METVLGSVKNFAEQANAEARTLLVRALRDLATALETPIETLYRVMSQPAELMVLQIAFDLKVFKILANSGESLSLARLATETGANAVLLNRVLRYLAAAQFIDETAEETYRASSTTQIFLRPGYEDGIWFQFYAFNKVVAATPIFLKDTKYQNLQSAGPGPFQKAFATEKSTYQWMSENSEYMERFNNFMSNAAFDGRQSWTKAVAIQHECKNRLSEGPLFVDVGGGFGSQAAAFRAVAGDIPGQVILQDLKVTIDQAPDLEGVEKMVHDFFTPQPVQGAKYYYLRNVLHNHDDGRAVELLKHLVSAMGSDSVILINEIVLPNTGTPINAAAHDLMMMVALGASERDEKQWRRLLDMAGLKVKTITVYETVEYEAIIEAVKG